MIESSNPEIDVQQLMERVRREVARAPREAAAPPAAAKGQPPPAQAEQAVKLPSLPDLPAMPPFQSSGPVDAKNERIDQILKQAREMTEAPSGVPKLFRSFFRKQGGFNRALLETVGSLAKTNAQLTKRVQELNSAAQHQTHWLQVLIEHRRADLNWMHTAAPVIASAAGSEQRVEQQLEERAQLVEERTQLVEERANQLEARMSEHDSATEELRSGLTEIRVVTARTEAGFGGVQPLLKSQTDQLRALRSDVTRSSEHLRNLQAQADASSEHLRNLQGAADRLLAISDQHERAAEHLRNLQTQADRQTEDLEAVRERLERDAEHLRNLQAQSDRSGEHLRHLQDESERATDQLKDFDRIRATIARTEAEIAHLADFRRTLARLEERQAHDSIYVKGQIAQHASLLRQWLNEPKMEEGAHATAAKAAEPAPDGALDAFYLSFENRFRGERAEIKERVRFYLPLLKKAKAGTAARPILDVGCGRGEWLELLAENDLHGSGVDLNSAMISECEARNFDVTRADAIEHLRSLRARTLGSVTGFHIIEHLPFTVLLELFAQTWRVLKPGGLAIFESPNCKSLMVGACYFNVDPTHRNPVFPETAQFILETQGFEEVRLEYLSPAERPFTGADHDAEMLNDLLFGPQDFAVIGRKPAAR